jgi:hypothetical protein
VAPLMVSEPPTYSEPKLNRVVPEIVTLPVT